MKTRSWLGVLCTALLSVGCGGSEQADSSEPAPAEMASPAPAADAGGHAATGDAERTGGEHAEGGEGREEHSAEGERSGGEHAEGGEHEGGEHEGEGHDEGDGESGVYISEAETWQSTRDGVALTLAYDPGYAVFSGRLSNQGSERACRVRVEVHLSTGQELGPTDPVDLAPGASTMVELPAGDAAFPEYTAHAELSSCGG